MQSVNIKCLSGSKFLALLLIFMFSSCHTRYGYRTKIHTDHLNTETEPSLIDTTLSSSTTIDFHAIAKTEEIHLRSMDSLNSLPTDCFIEPTKINKQFRKTASYFKPKRSTVEPRPISGKSISLFGALAMLEGALMVISLGYIYIFRGYYSLVLNNIGAAIFYLGCILLFMGLILILLNKSL